MYPKKGTDMYMMKMGKMALIALGCIGLLSFANYTYAAQQDDIM